MDLIWAILFLCSFLQLVILPFLCSSVPSSGLQFFCSVFVFAIPLSCFSYLLFVSFFFTFTIGAQGSSMATDLPGRDQEEMLSNVHVVLKTPLKGPYPEGFQRIVIATGCYWGAEKGFWRLPGVHTTAVGYAGGHTKNPTYAETCTGKTGHTEAVNVVWDPTKIATSDILRWFWECHDPTQKNRQGGDCGTQYRSAIYTTSDDQLALAKASMEAYSKALGGRTIHTEIKSMDEAGPFYFAHEGYQQYLARPKSRNYCSAEPQSVSLPPFADWAPEGNEAHAPKLGAAFWKKHAPTPHCVLRVPNEQLSAE